MRATYIVRLLEPAMVRAPPGQPQAAAAHSWRAGVLHFLWRRHTRTWPDPPLPALADALYLHFVGEINSQLEFAQFELRRIKYLVGVCGCWRVLAALVVGQPRAQGGPSAVCCPQPGAPQAPFMK